MLLTTFPMDEDFKKVKAVLDGSQVPYGVIEPSPSLARVAVGSLTVDETFHGQVMECLASTGVPISGWVEYREAVKTLPDGPLQEYEEDCFGVAAVTVLSPCVADDTKIRLVAHLTGDLAPVLPYLNAVMPQASYTPAAETMTYMDGYRMIALYPRRIAIAKADEIVDAWLTLESIRRQSNAAWNQRADIEPCYEVRKKPPALEIFKRLPGTNCGLCGEITCMAYAMRLWSGEARLRQCAPVFEPEHQRLRDALVEICEGLGLPRD